MDIIENEKRITRELYAFICKSENVSPLPLSFKRLNGASGYCSYHLPSKKPATIVLDIETGSFGAAYLLLHEFAHQKLLLSKGDATHGPAFKAELKRLEIKYASCDLANELLF
jgi:hypothetical protein